VRETCAYAPAAESRTRPYEKNAEEVCCRSALRSTSAKTLTKSQYSATVAGLARQRVARNCSLCFLENGARAPVSITISQYGCDASVRGAERRSHPVTWQLPTQIAPRRSH